MPEFKPSPIVGIFSSDWPYCPKCHEPQMPHWKTEAGPSGFEYRTFDCQKCGRTHTMIISSDPINYNLRGWLTGGELRRRTRSPLLTASIVEPLKQPK